MAKIKNFVDKKSKTDKKVDKNMCFQQLFI